MATFHLEVVSLDGREFDGEVTRVMLRTIDGDVAILARHTNYCSAIAMGTAHVYLPDDTVRTAACIGGMITMLDNKCSVLPTTWEWSDQIDVDRAKAAKETAEKRLADEGLSKEERVRAEAKLYRALVRISAAGSAKA